MSGTDRPVVSTAPSIATAAVAASPGPVPSPPTSPAALADLATASLSDALDALALPGSLHGIRPLRDGTRCAGPAFTVQYEPVDPTSPGTVGDFLDDVPAGAVVVIDNAGRTDCTVWGGIMTRTAAARGVAGTVIHGTCRDVASILDLGYPMWSSARFMRTGKDRVQLRTVQVPLHIDGVTINPGDWVCADDDGVVVVPAAQASTVAAGAARIEETEDVITAAVLGGATLTQARSQHGYHSLQTPGTPDGHQTHRPVNSQEADQ